MHKSERLCREYLIASLFEAGHRFLQSPWQILWMPAVLDAPVPAQCMFSVSRRRFPNASDRNRIKRLAREAYRRNKLPLYAVLQQKQMQIAMVIVYTGKSLTTFNEAEEKIRVALSTLHNKIAELQPTDHKNDK